MKNWRKIAWARQGRHTLSGVTLHNMRNENFRLDCARQCRNWVLRRMEDKKFMARIDRRIERRIRREHNV